MFRRAISVCTYLIDSSRIPLKNEIATTDFKRMHSEQSKY